MSILENTERIGKFTSSSVHKLIKTGRGKDVEFSAPGIKYIQEKKFERKLKRSIGVDKYSRSMAWGHFMEMYVFGLLPDFGYKILANETTSFDANLAGSTDLLKVGQKVADIKCFEPQKFCEYVEMFEHKSVDIFKRDFAHEYWQLVSNAIIHNVPNAEAICFMPYKSELEEIREMAANYDGSDQWKYRFIYEAPDVELPYIPDNSDYKNLNIFEFEVPQSDKYLLLQRIKLATKYL